MAAEEGGRAAGKSEDPGAKSNHPGVWGVPAAAGCCPGVLPLTEFSQQHLAHILNVIILMQLCDMVLQFIYIIASGVRDEERENC